MTRGAEVNAALDHIQTRLEAHDGRIAPAESAITVLEQAARVLRDDLARETLSRTESSRSIMAELPPLVNAIESAVAKGTADLEELEGRLRASLSEVSSKIMAE